MGGLFFQVATPAPPDGSWFFRNDPPSEWIWITILVAFVALGLAVPPVIAMILGRPKLTYRWRIESSKDMKWLSLDVRNQEIRPKWLRRLVRRERVEVSLHLSVLSERTGKSVANWIPRLSNINREEARTMSLAASPFSMASVGIVNRAASGAYVPDKDEAKDMTALPADSYICDVTVVAGEDVHLQQRRFVVSQDDLYWACKAYRSFSLSKDIHATPAA
jgi:hypothetical protein